jgi:hypothetical protein
MRAEQALNVEMSDGKLNKLNEAVHARINPKNYVPHNNRNERL